MFCITRLVCSTIPPSTILPVAGSSGIWPAVYRNPLAMIPCEYGPIADGAFSVVIFFEAIDAPVGVHTQQRIANVTHYGASKASPNSRAAFAAVTAPS